MEQWTLWLSILTGVVLILLIAPNVIAMNRGRALQNIALWLGVVVLLGWIYKAFGPFGTMAESPLLSGKVGDHSVEEELGDQAVPESFGTEPADQPERFDPPQEL